MLVEVDFADPELVTMTFAPGAGDMTIDHDSLGTMLATLERIETEPRCRALVLRGQPGCFGRGLDLNVPVRGHGLPETGSRYANLLLALRQARPVVFALVDGEATGGGLGIALAADVVLATEQSTFSLPELYWGLLPAIVLPVLLERVPPQKARRMALGGPPTDATTALRWGLIDELVADQAALATTLRGELRRVFKLRPSAVPEMKRHIELVRHLDLRQALELGRQSTTAHFGEPEVRAALEAFLSGGTPAWFSRPNRSR